jgi:hypothetical protein
MVAAYCVTVAGLTPEEVPPVEEEPPPDVLLVVVVGVFPPFGLFVLDPELVTF